jgi:anti-anti-sigma regulatory factor
MRADAHESMLRVGRTASGFLVQVEGRGTLSESPALQEFAAQSLDGPSGPSTVVVDLSHCDYLDSTFLGCLVNLHRKYNRAWPHRFQVAASCDKRQKLLAPTHLNHVLDLTEVCPELVTDVLEVSRPILPGTDLGRHVMECHRRLAELGGVRAAAFRTIAEQLARELGEAPCDGDPPTELHEGVQLARELGEAPCDGDPPTELHEGLSR